MALTMKLISVAYDMDEDVQTQKNREKALEAKNKSEENDQQDNDQFQGNSKKLLRKRKFFEKKANKEPVKEEPPEEELILAKMPSIFEYFGYALCPGTTVFGPWVSYKEYMDIFKTPKWVRQSIIILTFIFSQIKQMMYLLPELRLVAQSHLFHGIRIHVLSFVNVLDHLVYSKTGTI